MKHGLFSFTQVPFWAGQEAENEFEVPRDHLRHRILDLNQVAFWDVQEAENVFKVACEPLKQ